MNKFEKVSLYKDIDFNLPMRKTKHAAGYDFEVIEDIIIPPMISMIHEMENVVDARGAYQLPELAAITKALSAKPTLIPTGVKCQLDPNCYLELSVRSSTPLKYWIVLANSVGIIDADYYNNPDNEGHIFFQVINLSPMPIQLRKGDIIGQGIIHSYEITDNDCVDGVQTMRVGGFGSTTAGLKNNE